MGAGGGFGTERDAVPRSALLTSRQSAPASFCLFVGSLATARVSTSSTLRDSFSPCDAGVLGRCMGSSALSTSAPVSAPCITIRSERSSKRTNAIV